MRYEKPMVMDLSAGARAAGAPFGCFDGGAPESGSGFCQTGGSVTHVNDSVCTTGPVPGLGSTNANCYSGVAVAGVLTGCQSGGSVTYTLETCTSGPSPVL